MAYSTRTDLEGLLPERLLRQLTDDEGAGVVNDDTVTSAIQLADETIDGYLRGRYTVPLATLPVPRVLVGISRDLAAYELLSRRGEGGVPEEYRLRKKDAEKKLADIAGGILVLQVAAPDAQESVPIVVDKTACDRLFPPSLLERF